jgi:DNA-binding NtrC family response regulator
VWVVKRILLVDDDEQVREILRKRLLKSGFEVLEAMDAEAALDLFHNSPVDAVITDLVMPGKGGQALIKELRAADPDVRIVAISGALDQDVPALLAEADRLGALRTLPKPFTSEQLLDSIDSVMAAPQAAPRQADGPPTGGFESWLRSESALPGVSWGGVLLVTNLILALAALVLSILTRLGS